MLKESAAASVRGESRNAGMHAAGASRETLSTSPSSHSCFSVAPCLLGAAAALDEYYDGGARVRARAASRRPRRLSLARGGTQGEGHVQILHVADPSRPVSELRPERRPDAIRQRYEIELVPRVSADRYKFTCVDKPARLDIKQTILATINRVGRGARAGHLSGV